MNNWKKCKLGDAPLEFIDGDRGKNYPKQNEFYSNEYCLFLSTKNVRENGFDFSECQFITKEKDEILKKGKLKINDLVLTTRGTIGNLALYKENIPYKNTRINSGMLIIRPNNKELDSRYAFYLFKNLKDEFDNFVSGSAQPQLPIRDLKEVEILLPPLEEQRQIAAILSSIDDKIELLHEQNKTLEELAQTLFRYYFIENPSPSWQNVKLGDLVEETIGGEWGKENPIEDFKVPTYCFRGADIADLIAGLPKKIPLRYIKKAKLEKIEPKSGDILLEISGGTETQSTGRAIYIDDNIKKLFNYPIVFSNFCRLLRAKKIEYSYYLFFYLKYLYGNDEFFAFENGSSGIKNLDYKTLLNNTDCLKPDDEIFSFHKKVVLYFNKINKNKQQIQTLENMRDILIPKLLNGEIKVGGNQ